MVGGTGVGGQILTGSGIADTYCDSDIPGSVSRVDKTCTADFAFGFVGKFLSVGLITWAHLSITVCLQNTGPVVNGVGLDPDIVVAIAKNLFVCVEYLQSKSD